MNLGNTSWRFFFGIYHATFPGFSEVQEKDLDSFIDYSDKQFGSTFFHRRGEHSFFLHFFEDVFSTLLPPPLGEHTLFTLLYEAARQYRNKMVNIPPEELTLTVEPMLISTELVASLYLKV
jgi:hypothetical protein